jgi:hypothetical protein
MMKVFNKQNHVVQLLFVDIYRVVGIKFKKIFLKGFTTEM